jgi:hypothetical protein
MQSLDPVIYPIFIFAGAVVAAVVALLLATFLVTREVKRRRREAIGKWKNSRLNFVLGPSAANFLNTQRAFGAGGNGTLLLTTESLRFAQASPNREIVIPLVDIETALLMKDFNGRWGGGPFLVVRRKVGDLTGFQIGGAQKWQQTICQQLEAVNAQTMGATWAAQAA